METIIIKVSELLGKPVISLLNAETLGIAGDIVFDSKMLTAKAIKILQDDNDNETETLYIELKHIKDLLLDALCITHKKLTKSEWHGNRLDAKNPINASCYNQDGKKLGTVRDVVLDDFKVTEIVIEETETNNFIILTPATLLSHSKDNLIFNDTGKPIKIIAPKKATFPKSKNKSTPISVKLHSVPKTTTIPAIDRTHNFQTLNNDNSQPPDIQYPTKVPQENTMVYRSPASIDTLAGVYAFLLGKTLSRSIKDNNDNIIAQPQSIITQETIELAKNNSKLIQLALYAD